MNKLRNSLSCACNELQPDASAAPTAYAQSAPSAVPSRSITVVMSKGAASASAGVGVPIVPVAQAIPIHADDLQDAIRRRSVSLHARLRVADAIQALALDIVDDDSLSDTDRAWLRSRLAAAVSEATEEALVVLTQELGELLAVAPPRLRPSILGRALIRRTDFE